MWIWMNTHRVHCEWICTASCGLIFSPSPSLSLSLINYASDAEAFHGKRKRFPVRLVLLRFARLEFICHQQQKQQQLEEQQQEKLLQQQQRCSWRPIQSSLSPSLTKMGEVGKGSATLQRSWQLCNTPLPPSATVTPMCRPRQLSALLCACVCVCACSPVATCCCTGHHPQPSCCRQQICMLLLRLLLASSACHSYFMSC